MPQTFSKRGFDERRIALINRFDYADRYRKDYEEVAERCYQLYECWREEVEGRANVFIPMTYQEIDTVRARLVKSFFGQRPYCDFVPAPGYQVTDPQIMAERDVNAKLAAALVDQQLYKNCITAKFYQYVTDFMVYPAGFMSVGWRYEVRMVKYKLPIEVPIITPWGPAGSQVILQDIESEETVWDDNYIDNLDFWNVWVDPRGESCNPDTWRFCFIREFATRSRIEQYLELLDSTGAGKVFKPDWEEIGRNTSWDNPASDRMGSVGRTAAIDDGYETEKGEDGEPHKSSLYQLLHYWEDNQHCLLIENTALVFEGDNPYKRHGKKPILAHSYEPRGGEPYGRSAVELLADMQEELNTNRNQRIDAMSFALNKGFQVRRDADIDESELISRPNMLIHVDAIDRDVKEITIKDINPSTFTDEQIIKIDMENTLATPAVIRGAQSSRKETATADVLRSSNASLRFDVKIALLEELGIKRLLYLMDCNNQEFINQARLVKVFGVHQQTWNLVRPGQLIGEYDYRPSGLSTDPAVNKELRRQQLSEMMAFVLKAQIPYADRYELFREWINSFDLRNTDKFLIPKEMIAEQAMQDQAALQQIKQLMLMMRGADGQALPQGAPMQAQPQQMPMPQGIPMQAQQRMPMPQAVPM